MRLLAVVGFVALFAQSSPVLSCGSLGPLKSLSELVADSSGIYLAEVRALEIVYGSSGSARSTASLALIERLDGQTFSESVASIAVPEGETVDHTLHRNHGFWEVGNGNAVLMPDCEFLPVLALGQMYLVFDGVNDPRAYEPIFERDDFWFRAVSSQIDGSESPLISFVDYWRRREAVFLGRCARLEESPYGYVVTQNLIGNYEVSDPLEWKGRTTCRKKDGQFLAIKSLGFGSIFAIPVENSSVDLSWVEHALYPAFYKHRWLLEDVLVAIRAAKN